MSVLRVGVVGTGTLAQVYHLPNLARMESVELAAICDAQRKLAAALGRKFGVAKVFTDAVEMFRGAELDAALICTPTHLHMPYTVQALRHGLHVLVEYPAALNAKEILKIRGELQKHPGLVLRTGNNSRFRRDAEILRHSLQKGELGRVFYVKCGWLQRYGSEARKSWRYDPDISGGGVLMDQGAAIIDLLLWLLDFPEVLTVDGECFHRMLQKKVEDTVSIQLKLESELLLHMDASWSLLPDQGKAYCYIFGDKGSAFLNPLRISRDAAGKRYSFTPVNLPTGASLFRESYAR